MDLIHHVCEMIVCLILLACGHVLPAIQARRNVIYGPTTHHRRANQAWSALSSGCITAIILSISIIGFWMQIIITVRIE